MRILHVLNIVYEKSENPAAISIIVMRSRKKMFYETATALEQEVDISVDISLLNNEKMEDTMTRKFTVGT